MVRALHEGLLADGFAVPLTKLCPWFGVQRRTVYYKPVKSPPKIDPVFEEPIKAMIEENPSFGYRTVASLLGFNKNTVQRIFQLKGWQMCKRPVGSRPRIEAHPSVAEAPNERWSTDVARVWAGKDGWPTLALVMDCHTRELLGWHLSRSGKASTAASALEHALIARFETLGQVETLFLLRSDNGVCQCRSDRRRDMAHPPAERDDGAPDPITERTMRAPSAVRKSGSCKTAIGDRIQFYNMRRPHQALEIKTQTEAFKLAA